MKRRDFYKRKICLQQSISDMLLRLLTQRNFQGLMISRLEKSLFIRSAIKRNSRIYIFSFNNIILISMILSSSGMYRYHYIQYVLNPYFYVISEKKSLSIFLLIKKQSCILNYTLNTIRYRKLQSTIHQGQFS